MVRRVTGLVLLVLGASAAGAQLAPRWWAAADGKPVDASAEPACRHNGFMSRTVAHAGGEAWVLGRADAGSLRTVLLRFTPAGAGGVVDVLPAEFASGAQYELAPAGAGVAAIGTRSHWNGTTSEVDTWVAAWDADAGRRFLSILDLAAGADDAGLDLAAGAGGGFFGAAWRLIGGVPSSVVFRLSDAGELLWSVGVPGENARGLVALAEGGAALATDGDAGPRVHFFTDGGVPTGVASVASDPARDETLNALAVGPGGHLAAVGSSCLASTCEALAALVVGGETAWSLRIRPPGIGPGAARATVVDGAGRVFVAGYHAPGGVALRVLVAGLSPEGELLWTEGGIGGSGHSNLAQALALAPDGGVIAVGSVDESGSYSDYLVARFDPASGALVWSAIVDSGEQRPDDACGVDVDPSSGRVFVTGSASRSTNDIWTIGMSEQGQVLWQAKEPPLAPSEQRVGGLQEADAGRHVLALDAEGGAVFVGAGRTDDGPEGLVGRVDPAGGIDWMRPFPGPIGESPELRATAVASDGTIFVAGRGGDTGEDFLTAALDRDGQTRWTRTIPAWLSDGALALAALPDGGVVVTGEVRSDFNFDALTVRYDRAGNELWRRVLDRFNERGVDVVQLPEGRIAVLADVQLAQAPYVMCLVAVFDATGGEIWQRDIFAPSGTGARCQVLGVDGSGGLLAGGWAEGRPMVTRMRPDGEIEWQAQPAAEGSASLVRALGVAADGDVIAVGSATVEGRAAAWIGRFSSAGVLRWERVEPGGTPGTSGFFDVGLGADGTVHAISLRTPNGQEARFEIFTYTPGGEPVGVITSADLLAARILPSLALETTADGGVVVAATAERTETSKDALIAAFGPAAIFADGFETGDTSRWSLTLP